MLSLEEYFGNTSIIQAGNLIESLNNHVFSLKDVGIHPRVIGYWDTEGILYSEWNIPDTRRRYSFIDYVWIKIIEQLREFGVSLKVIRHLKGMIFEKIPLKDIYDLIYSQPELLDQIGGDEIERNQLKKFIISGKYKKATKDISLSPFLLLLAEIITQRVQGGFTYYLDGTWMPWTEAYNSKELLSEDRHKRMSQPGIIIPVSSIIKEFLVDEQFISMLPKVDIIDDKERKLLEVIQSGEYETITVHFKGKKMQSLEMVKEQDVKKKIVDIISENAYQDIFLKEHNGRITRIQNIVKVKF